MTNTSQLWAVVPAAGIGSRFESVAPKQYSLIGSMTVLEHSISRLIEVDAFTKIVVVLHANDTYWSRSQFLNHPKITTTLGGNERYHSVLNGLSVLEDIASDDDWVLVHDAARPCVNGRDIVHLIDSLKDHLVGGLLGVSVADTLKRVGPEGDIVETVDRDNVWAAQTPQMFRIGLLRQAILHGLANNIPMTDEAMAIEKLGYSPRIIAGARENIKITVSSDLIRAEEILTARGVIA